MSKPSVFSKIFVVLVIGTFGGRVELIVTLLFVGNSVGTNVGFNVGFQVINVNEK